MNERIKAIPPSATLRITSRAKAMVAEGRAVCNFAGGEPDFDTPEAVKQAAIRALEAGETKYTPVAGLPALREAIARKLKADNGLDYDASRIVVSNGGKHSLFNVMMALCGEGDEVLIPSPYWLSYPQMVRIAGGVPAFVEGDDAHGFKVTAEDVEAKITARTKVLLINSPSNPCGIVYDRAELQALVDVAERHGLYLVSDEIYEKLVYDGAEHVSPGSLSGRVFERTITCNGLSKAYSMTGWRLGYLAGPTDVVKAVIALQGHSTSAPNTFAQYGAVEALGMADAAIGEMVRAFDERRTYLFDRLNAMVGVQCVKPRGAFYMLPNIGALGMDSLTFAERLLESEAVAVVPGLPFGSDAHVRISYACSMDTIREGADRLERFIGSL